jgi:hypothetical protein
VVMRVRTDKVTRRDGDCMGLNGVGTNSGEFELGK